MSATAYHRGFSAATNYDACNPPYTRVNEPTMPEILPLFDEIKKIVAEHRAEYPETPVEKIDEFIKNYEEKTDEEMARVFSEIQSSRVAKIKD